MDNESLFTYVKSALRITTDDSGITSEIKELIASALMDLQLSGVKVDAITYPLDSLVVRAVVTYCKANFGFDNPESEKLMSSFRMLETHLALSSDYGDK